VSGNHQTNRPPTFAALLQCFTAVFLFLHCLSFLFPYKKSPRRKWSGGRGVCDAAKYLHPLHPLTALPVCVWFIRHAMRHCNLRWRCAATLSSLKQPATGSAVCSRHQAEPSVL